MIAATATGPVRAGRATPTRRSGQPTSLRQRGGTFSRFFTAYVFSQVPGQFFLRRAWPLSAQTGRRETFANAPIGLFPAFGNSHTECLRIQRSRSVNVAIGSAFLLNGTGSNPGFGHTIA
ncbi:hypothetical protein KDW69_14360 [Burkholderia ambifaria]|uniref:hypothetical protein n=1 Tax=Burkholderia ambifaria TaxID=152480 RepID=UPI00158ED95E|nr:hypothetical protein [Burkholderia ambifaria]MBR8332826.1 hypothetical protein [Burkholderia ambifaria]